MYHSVYFRKHTYANVAADSGLAFSLGLGLFSFLVPPSITMAHTVSEPCLPHAEWLPETRKYFSAEKS